MRFLALMLALIATTAQAATLEVTVQHPTTYADGTALPASGEGSLTAIRVQYGTCSGASFGTVQGEKIVAMPTNKVTFTGLPIAVTCIRAYWRNSFGESAASAVSFAGPAPSAGAVVIVTVTP